MVSYYGDGDYKCGGSNRFLVVIKEFMKLYGHQHPEEETLMRSPSPSSSTEWRLKTIFCMHNCSVVMSTTWFEWQTAKKFKNF